MDYFEIIRMILLVITMSAAVVMTAEDTEFLTELLYAVL